MLQESNAQPTPKDDSDEGRPASFFAGDVKLDKTSKPKSLGETIGAARKRELLQNKEKEKETFEAGAYVRENVAAGIERKERLQGVSSRQQKANFDRTERLKVKEQTKSEDLDREKSEAEQEKIKKHLEGKFDRAKRSLADAVRSTGREATTLKEEIKRLESKLADAGSALGDVADQKKDAKHEISKLERDINDLKEEEKRLEEDSKKGVSKDDFPRRAVKRKLSEVARKLRDLKDVVKSRSESSRLSRAQGDTQKKLDNLNDKRAELLERQKKANGLLRSLESAKSKSDKRVWDDFDRDLKSIDIHVK